MSPAKIIFFGTLGVFSHAVLQQLLRHKLHISSVVVPGTEPFKMPTESMIKIPVLQQPQHETIELLAIKHNIPLNYIHTIDSEESYSALSAYDADFILIACFPFILPAPLRALPKVACLNLHPSLLPAYRGPTPLFWQLKHGEALFGVTLHMVSQKIDAGNIILQEQIRLRDGMRARAIDAALGELGAALFVEALDLYDKHSIVPKIQDSSKASYFPVPGVIQFELSSQWSARQAFNFMRGTDEWKQTYRISLDNQDFYLVNPIAYSPAGTINEAYQIHNGVITVQFAQGLLQAELRP
jgi:methionyl-tRNA formyltransferase